MTVYRMQLVAGNCKPQVRGESVSSLSFAATWFALGSDTAAATGLAMNQDGHRRSVSQKTALYEATRRTVYPPKEEIRTKARQRLPRHAESTFLAPYS